MEGEEGRERLERLQGRQLFESIKGGKVSYKKGGRRSNGAELGFLEQEGSTRRWEIPLKTT